MATDQRDLLYLQTGLKQTTDALMTQVVKANVCQPHRSHGALKRCADGLRLVRHDAVLAGYAGLTVNNSAGLVGHGDYFVTDLGRVLGVPQDHRVTAVIRPLHGQQLLSAPGQVQRQQHEVVQKHQLVFDVLQQFVHA